MFTGIVEEVGDVQQVEVLPGRTRLAIAGERVLEGTRLGDSIAVNGVCLTVVALAEAAFVVEAVPETLRKTNLGQLTTGSAVNLERAMTLGRFFGGHYVQGHVDGRVTVARVDPDGDAFTVRFEPEGPSGLPQLRYLVPKGYVTLDGISLTVAALDDSGFAISLIPHTFESVSFAGGGLGKVSRGALVNLEVDVVAKYVERFVAPT